MYICRLRFLLQALFLLMRCNYDPDEALQRLRFRTVSPTEIPGYMEAWSEADSTAFEKGFALYNKDFRQIRETRLRHKTVGELVHYYYLWKKTVRHDRFARTYRRDKRKSPHPSIT
ncbi:Myb DNA-binding domain protein [Paragonimus heterotremus]|uniref:Myb DNA-binding domain protein n=1 Tax=Paragonimus heterotremus TaxID=100268 RepID=A0A8J4SEY6_9TREM|nr:Myb DNA-binding domain protein [Paragonimus heterotremus]